MRGPGHRDGLERGSAGAGVGTQQGVGGNREGRDGEWGVQGDSGVGRSHQGVQGGTSTDPGRPELSSGQGLGTLGLSPWEL